MEERKRQQGSLILPSYLELSPLNQTKTFLHFPSFVFQEGRAKQRVLLLGLAAPVLHRFRLAV